MIFVFYEKEKNKNIMDNELFYDAISVHEEKVVDFLCMINNSNYEYVSLDEEVDDVRQCLRSIFTFYNSNNDLIVIQIETFYNDGEQEED